MGQLSKEWDLYVKGTEKCSDLTFKHSEFTGHIQGTVSLLLASCKKDEKKEGEVDPPLGNLECSFIPYKCDENVQGTPDNALEFARHEQRVANGRVHLISETGIVQPNVDGPFFVIQRTFYCWKSQIGELTKKNS